MTRALGLVLLVGVVGCGSSGAGEHEDLDFPVMDFATSDLPDLSQLPEQTSCNQTQCDICDDYLVMSGDVAAAIAQLNQACAAGLDNLVSSTPCMKIGYANDESCAMTKDGITETTYAGTMADSTFLQNFQQSCTQAGGTFTAP